MAIDVFRGGAGERPSCEMGHFTGGHSREERAASAGQDPKRTTTLLPAFYTHGSLVASRGQAFHG